MRPASGESAGLWQIVPLAFAIAGLYLLLHPYDGIVRDARYLLQPLSHLHPDLHRNDVFLKFSSEDNYTVFTPLHARPVSLVGAEAATSLITFFSSLAVLTSGWLLVRTQSTAVRTWLGVGLLVILTGYYGMGATFTILEGFATPRMPAEALVLFAITARISNRRLLTSTALAGRILLHPIVAFPAIVLLFVTEWRLSNLRPLAALVAIGAAIAIVCMTALAMLSVTWTSAVAEASLASRSWLDLAMIACTNAFIPTLALIMVWCLAWKIRSLSAASITPAIVAVPVACAASATGDTCFIQKYAPQAKAALSAWRNLTPPGTDVLWATRLMEGSDPATVSLLLERLGFYSSVQANTGLFSRTAAAELDRRLRIIPVVLPTELPFNVQFSGQSYPPASYDRLPSHYTITADIELPDAKLVQTPQGVGEPFSRLKLWRCPSGTDHSAITRMSFRR
jgi:hypothetical protein